MEVLSSTFSARPFRSTSTLHSPGGAFFSSFADVQVNAVVGPDVWRMRLNVTPPAPPDNPAYAHYHVDFDTSEGWLLSIAGGPNAVATQAQIDTVLTNAALRSDGQAALFIRADYFTGIETAFIDNVRVISSVPEPATSILLAGGLIVLARRIRRSKA